MKAITIFLWTCMWTDTLGTISERDEEIYMLLDKYGYIERETNASQSDLNADQQSLFNEGISRFQKSFNLPVTGKIDFRTVDLLGKPRCGNEDSFNFLKSDTQNRKWSSLNIKWGIYGDHHPNGLTAIVQKAFNVWSKHVNLHFRRVLSDANILIAFKSGKHELIRNDKASCLGCFDGMGGILGHADYPDINKNTVEIHLDKDEDWDLTTTTLSGKTNLFLVLVHEIGHALGLDHNNEFDSIMFPSYGFLHIENFTLSQNDIHAIQKLYGNSTYTHKVSTTTTTTSKPTPKIETTTLKSTSRIETTSHETIAPFTLSHICDIDDKLSGFLIYKKIIYIHYKQWVWSIDLKSKMPVRSTPINIIDWLKPLRGVLEATNYNYKVSFGSNDNLIVIINHSIYIIELRSMSIRYKWDFEATGLGFNNHTNITGVVTSNYGSPFIFFDGVYAVQVDYQYVKTRQLITSVADEFPGIPSHFDGVCKSSDGLLNFFVGNKIVRYNEYLRETVDTVDKSLSILGISCPYTSIIDQLKFLLSKISSSSKISVPG
ncbi:stromelysin-1-like [Onthophagus taurus]|uniref:stromelysin-1-like n=1 Tax=Onthophagus taurus TaxID=166361 RepID=UPI0039BE34D1